MLSLGSPRAVDAQIEGLETWARSVAEGLTPKWRGPLVPVPGPSDRPRSAYSLRSWLYPLAVHASRDVPFETSEAALDALEEAYDQLRARGWDAPYPDGGRGGTAGFDLYVLSATELEAWKRIEEAHAGALTLRDDLRQHEQTQDSSLSAELDGWLHAGAHPTPVLAGADARVPWSFWDGVSAFGVVESAALEQRPRACVTSAYADAILLGLDPAEALAWRRATADALAFAITGEYGCTDAVVAQQRAPGRGWIQEGVGDGSGGALFLSLLSEHKDGGTGDFLLYLWQFARQRSYEDGLRALPDLWHTLDHAEKLAKSRLDPLMETIAVERFFAGTDRPESSHHALRLLPATASVPLEAEVAWRDLPLHTKPVDPPLGAYGSGYALIDVGGRPSSSYLRVWVRGELGVGWALTAVLLDERRVELRRVSAPPRRKPGAYSALELTGDPSYVLLVVTNLGSALPSPLEPKPDLKSFRFIVDLVTPEEASREAAGK